MSETLSIRLPDDEKQRLRLAARQVGESVAEYVRKAALTRAKSDSPDEWDRHFGTVDGKLPVAPRNKDVRRIMKRAKAD